MVLLKKESMLNKLINLKLYFLAKSTNKLIYSNYFLLGHRKNYIIYRPNSIYESINRLKLFSSVLKYSKPNIWAIGFKPKFYNPTRWLSYQISGNFIMFTGSRGILFYVNSRYFWVSHKFFTYKLFFNLGIDLLILLDVNYPSNINNLLKIIGVPSIGICNGVKNLGVVDYPLLNPDNNLKTFIFFLKLINFFLKK